MENATTAHHKAVEQVFGMLYATPLARAAAGLAGAPAARRSALIRCGANWHEREAEDLRASAGKGTVQDGIVRILLLLMNEQGAIDERTYRALRIGAGRTAGAASADACGDP